MTLPGTLWYQKVSNWGFVRDKSFWFVQKKIHFNFNDIGNPWLSDTLPFFSRVLFFLSNSAFLLLPSRDQRNVGEVCSRMAFLSKGFLELKWLKINSPHVVCQLHVFLHYIFFSCVLWFTQSIACNKRCLMGDSSKYLHLLLIP